LVVLLLAVLLAFQNEPTPNPTPTPMHSRDRAGIEPSPNTRFEIGPIFQYWLPQFRGSLRADGTSKQGTPLNLVQDLGLPNDAAIPMYGGGALGVWVLSSPTDATEVLFAAEYWGHTWSGHHNLALPTTLGDDTFPAGTAVESQFHLTSLTLDAMGALSNDPLYVGLCLSLQARSARLRMESATVQSKASIDDFYWGGGLFGEVRPIPFIMAGLSIKGYTSFGDGFETGAGDFRFYAGFRWKALSLEGGYRILLYDLNDMDQKLQYSMRGPYVALNALWRF
jgi:hypothetical protein